MQFPSNNNNSNKLPIGDYQNDLKLNKYKMNYELSSTNYLDVPKEVDDYIDEYLKKEELQKAKTSLPLSQTAENPYPVIENIVCLVELKCELDLTLIAKSARNTEYNARYFSALVMRIKDPKTTALIFKNGKIVCLGAKTIENARIATRKFAKIIKKLGFKIRYENFKIHNMVASYNLKFQIGLDALKLLHGTFATYDPEIFPGLSYKIADSSITILIFKSGKIILTGSKSKIDIDEAFDKILPVLNMFKKEIPNQKNIKH